jgi:hypothetical protein
MGSHRMLVRFIPVLLLFACGAPAHAQIWRCEGASGVVEYTNAPSDARSGRDCKQINPGPITTIPAPPPPKGAAPRGTGNASASGGAAGGFPKVDAATQKARDSDRRRILEEELQKEEGRLADLKKEYNNGEPDRLGGERNYQRYLDRVQYLKEGIARSEANIDSIKRELAALKE